MKYYVAIAAVFIAVASFGGDRIGRADRAFVGSPAAASSAADCRAGIPKGSSLHQAAIYVIAHCEDPPADCRPNIPSEKLQGKTYQEVELRTLIACGTRAGLQAFFHRGQDRRDRQIAERDRQIAEGNAFIAQSQAASAREQDRQDRIMAGVNADIARSITDSKLDEIASGLRGLGR
jgi:hypothetical protein